MSWQRKVSELKDRSIEIIHLKNRERKRLKKNEQNLMKQFILHVVEIPQREEKESGRKHIEMNKE